ncbi:acylphosphatase [Candidatus Borrarchaeum sp.]|uniref:acylphosphatase n=1 Tax=Candidatus Borrarchaeum sp. TaxID=2846742 RepID=UPI00257A2843|nr:acylphosphatase [Candidatus Borrarchaeum sp.]
MSVRAHVWVSGRVHGVFFRATTRRVAKRFGLTGWVKNLRDGRVEAIFEGPREKVDEMIKFCHEGPPTAIIKNVEVKWEDPTGTFDDFDIAF